MAEQAKQHRPPAPPRDLSPRAATAANAGAAALTQLAGEIDGGPRVAALRAVGEAINGSPRVAQLRAWGVAVNDDAGLEREADVMGAEAARLPAGTSGRQAGPAAAGPAAADAAGAVVQGVFNPAGWMAVAGGQDDDVSTGDLESADYAKKSLELHQGEPEDFGMDDEDWEAQESEPVLSGPPDFAQKSLELHQGEPENFGLDDEDWEEPESEPVLSGPPGAYIVNAILPYTQIGEIPTVIEAMVEGLRDGPEGHVAVVLGINAPSDKGEELDAAMAKAEQIVEAIPFPVGLVASTFPAKKDFPFGTMRNAVLHSPETRLMTNYFVGSGYHPYISFQDFDTGSRRVGSDEGPHVFDAVDDILAGLLKESDETGLVDPIRPLMIGGGYRSGSQEALVEATWARVQAAIEAKPKGKSKGKAQASKKKLLKTLTKEKVEQQLENFPALIEEDMEARDEYARLDPLLPYAPEPNLFIDATAAALPSPVSGTRLEFGPGGAEFTALGKALGLYAAEELSSHYERQLPPDFKPEDLERDSSFPADQLTAQPDALDQLGKLMVDAQTNRHPVRGTTIVTDFKNLSTATDLSRLALGHVSGTKPQSHIGLTQVTDRFFDNKAAKTGASFAEMRDAFNDEEDPVGFLTGLYARPGGIQKPESAQYFVDNKALLGGAEGQTMSGALQQPFPGPFSGYHFGTSPQQAVYFGHQLALQRELDAARMQWEEMRRQEAEAKKQSDEDEEKMS